jgi:hypothetical protein
MPQQPGSGPNTEPSSRKPKRLDLENGPTKYLDRPANEGKHGDADEEPNEGFPRSDDDESSKR